MTLSKPVASIPLPSGLLRTNDPGHVPGSDADECARGPGPSAAADPGLAPGKP